MNNFYKIVFDVSDENIKDELLAQLSNLQFEGFEETQGQLISYIQEEKFNENEFAVLMQSYGLTYSQSVVEPQNWNALWESNFMPVVVDDFCTIRAEFHEPAIGTVHEIIITPKMSFGTGHHATTYLMISEMQKLDFTGKRVADFGTGTGILAILGNKLGSEKIIAIDNDDWSIENALENLEKNNCDKIEVQKADAFIVNETFDIILANINKNVILDNIGSLSGGVRNGGKLLLSGLLMDDEKDILNACQSQGLSKLLVREKDNWICILLTR